MNGPYNAANRKHVRDAEKLAKLRDQNEGVILRTLLDTVDGREWVWNVLSDAHIFDTIPPVEQGAVYYALGERNQGLRILSAILKHCPEQFVQMMRESNERRTLEQSKSASAKRSGGEDGGRDVEGRSGEYDTEYDPDDTD